LRVTNHTYSLVFFFEFFPTFLFFYLFKVLFKLLPLFGAFVGKVCLTRRATYGTLKLYSLSFEIKGELFGKYFIAFTANKRGLDIILTELVSLHPERGVCQVIFFAYV
jgi:hypothetical protein